MQRSNVQRSKKRVPKEALYPPQLTIPINVGKTYRFVSSAATSRQLLNYTGILDLLCMATTATAAHRIMRAVKIKKIEIWATSPSLDVPVTIAFQKTSGVGGNFGSSLLKSDTSMGFDRPAHLVVKFSEKEQNGQWHDGAATGEFGQISVPKGAVVDFTYTANVVDQSGESTTVTAAVAGATVGQVYLRALDNVAITPVLVPVNMATI